MRVEAELIDEEASCVMDCAVSVARWLRNSDYEMTSISKKYDDVHDDGLSLELFNLIV